MIVPAKYIVGGLGVLLIGAAVAFIAIQREQIKSLNLEKNHAIEFAAKETARADGATKSLAQSRALYKLHQTTQNIPLADYKAEVSKINKGIGRLDNAARHKPQLVEDGINDATFNLMQRFQQFSAPKSVR